MRLFFLLMLLTCGGCSSVQYLDEAFALKAYSDEKDAQNNYVKLQDARFEKLLEAARSPEGFQAYGRKAALMHAFGEPVFCRPSGDLEECLYRRIVKAPESPKVYFYFNGRGELVRWQEDGR